MKVLPEFQNKISEFWFDFQERNGFTALNTAFISEGAFCYFKA